MTSMDLRDMTPEPPAMLDPWFVLRNRERARIYLATGEWTWPKLPPMEVEDWSPAARGPFGPEVQG